MPGGLLHRPIRPTGYKLRYYFGICWWVWCCNDENKLNFVLCCTESILPGRLMYEMRPLCVNFASPYLNSCHLNFKNEQKLNFHFYKKLFTSSESLFHTEQSDAQF